MATILNYRDIVLQATTPRMITVTLDPGVIVPATKAITLVTSSPVFLVTTFGVATPSSITFTATNRYVTGTISFSVTAGTATLTGSGGTSPATRTLTLANMTTNSVTVRATVTDTDGTVYTSDTIVTKVLDGQDGNRGSITIGSNYYGWSVSAWNDQYANRLINNVLTGASLTTALATTTHLRIGDMATLSNTANTYRETRFWTGGSWAVPGEIWDGAVLVRGSVSATAIFTTTLSAIVADLGTITAGSITSTSNIDVSGQARFRGNNTTGGFTTAVTANDTTNSAYGVLGYAGTNGAGFLGFGGTTSGTAGFRALPDNASVGVDVTASTSSFTGVGIYSRITNASATGIAIKAETSAAGQTALAVVGKMTMSDTTLVSNLNAEMWNGKKWNGTGTGAATATLTLTNKPGASVANTWLRIDDSAGTLVGYVPFWTT